jgi:hypothetical protein
MFRELGQVVATQGALEALGRNRASMDELLGRYTSNDWGDIDDTDRLSNDDAVQNGQRVVASYTMNDGSCVFVITEWDRSYTTLLTPSEY